MASHREKSRPPLGSGERFRQMKRQLMKKGYSAESATKIAASIGWKKYGKRMGQMASAARRKKG